ncbi:CAP domain-containing protein [Ramlibacter sp. PS4R-6]|uniref:CAP domain-containing protein n=1 Tax=Ramlibacter sp. PS4R-6 TaxID=3133438 RepID=UPI003098CB6E
MQYRYLALSCATALSLALAACGGGGDSTAAVATQPVSGATDPNAPAVTGDTATDAINRFNWRRQQIGLLAVSRNAAIDRAAQAHSNYQGLNNTITHFEEAGKAGFTGAGAADRLQAAGYSLSASAGYAYGEVIASQGGTQGVVAADDLIGAIYHRFIVFEPMFKEAGAGSGTAAGGGLTYVTIDFAANGLDRILSRGNVAVYPFNGQSDVPASVNSDQESPDPVPGQNRVGYPVSVHGNLGSTLTVQALTITPRGGAALATRLLTHATDGNTPTSAAAAIPLSALVPGTTYDVHFTGTVDGVAVARNWSFSAQ